LVFGRRHSTSLMREFLHQQNLRNLFPFFITTLSMIRFFDRLSVYTYLGKLARFRTGERIAFV
jgi:hypothetical protein